MGKKGVQSRRLERISPDMDPTDFFKKFVATRTPVVLTGLLRDDSFQARKWTSLKYLKRKAGSVQVMVEPMHAALSQYGTGEKRIKKTFSAFLESLAADAGPYDYLTTQYIENDEAEVPDMFPAPTRCLVDDFPVTPSLTGNLVLQQVNLWIGKSEEGSSSGLHHDFHDNLYCLLSGRKRLVLYPPHQAPNLYPSGIIDKIHENGLISYRHAPAWSDGLSEYDEARYRAAALRRKLSVMTTKHARPLDFKAVKKSYRKALEAFRAVGGDAEGGDADEDDADAILARLESEEGDEEEEWGGITSEPEESDSDESKEPSSFSRIPTYTLHRHLNLSTTALPPADKTTFPKLRDSGPPFVVDLNAGEMLYLPASWWHEVTSFGASDPHMAFNYWFHPPDDLQHFDLPYRDTMVWKYLRDVVRREGKKRKGPGEEGEIAIRKRQEL